MATERPYISINEACAILGISRPTFQKIRKQKALREFVTGKRPRFLREDVLKLVGSEETAGTTEKRLEFTTFGTATLPDLLVRQDTYDLSRIWRLDPFGVITLLCGFSDLASEGRTLTLQVKDNYICNLLRSLNFFVELDRLHRGKIITDLSKLPAKGADYSYPLPLSSVHARKQESRFIEQLAQLLKEQGFSENIGGYIGWIIGELADNSMTHLVYNNTPSDCYLLAQRYRRKDGIEYIIVGVGDPGPGIQTTLRRNPKYAALSDEEAFLTAFKQNVSSWSDEYGRGKGLTNVLTIAMGNQSPLKAQSCDLVLTADFKNGTRSLTRDPKGIKGTRLAIFLVDKDFFPTRPDEADAYIDDFLRNI